MLTGTSTTQTGHTVPLDVTLIKFDGKWLVDSLYSRRSGLKPSATQNIPDVATPTSLVRAIIKLFAEANNSGDVSDFHASIAQWRVRHYN